MAILAAHAVGERNGGAVVYLLICEISGGELDLTGSAHLKSFAYPATKPRDLQEAGDDQISVSGTIGEVRYHIAEALIGDHVGEIPAADHLRVQLDEWIRVITETQALTSLGPLGSR